MTNPLTAALERRAGSRKRNQVHPTREQEEIHAPVHGDAERPWVPASNLSAPPPRPGMVQRWVRTDVQGTSDPNNVASRLREGWQPRRADTVPAGYDVPTINHGQWTGVIGIHGMILCEIPRARMEARARYIAELTRKQTQAVEQGLARVSDPRVPLQHHRKTEVVKKLDPTRARTAVAADNEEG